METFPRFRLHITKRDCAFKGIRQVDVLLAEPRGSDCIILVEQKSTLTRGEAKLNKKQPKLLLISKENK